MMNKLLENLYIRSLLENALRKFDLLKASYSLKNEVAESCNLLFRDHQRDLRFKQ